MANGDVILRERGVHPLYRADLQTIYSSNSNVTAPPVPRGMLGFIYDAFGYRVFSFRQNVSGSAFAAGELASRGGAGTLNVVSNIDSGSTSTIVEASVWGASPKNVGAIVIVHDNNDAAGGAPEGEYSIVASHTTATLTLDAALPLSVAAAANDDVTLIGLNVVDSQDGDFNVFVCGVSMTAVGDQDFAWFQCNGLHPKVKHSAATCTAGDPVVAGAACVAAFGSDAAPLWVGFQPATHTSDVVSTNSPVVMTLLATHI
jgi:hypothetical protein